MPSSQKLKGLKYKKQKISVTIVSKSWWQIVLFSLWIAAPIMDSKKFFGDGMAYKYEIPVQMELFIFKGP